MTQFEEKWAPVFRPEVRLDVKQFQQKRHRFEPAPALIRGAGMRQDQMKQGGGLSHV
jgi:hypothetical protein